MRKGVFLYLLALLYANAIIAQNRATEAVTKFGNNISNWCQYTKTEYKKAAISNCAGSNGMECLVYDALMLEFERRKNREPVDDYLLSDYMLGFESAMYEGSGIRVTISNIKEETNVRFDNASMSDEKRHSLYYVSCDVNVSGAMNFTSKDLFCIRKGSGLISQIAPFVGVQEQGSTREKALVNTSRIKDWDHIAAGEFNSIEASYGYSKNFPLNVGLAASFSYFNIGLEYGQNFDKEPIITKQHTNFASSQINGKYFYLMASPGVFLRFATISYGLGATMMKYNYESVYDSYSENKTFFTMKPKVAFNLPLPVDFKSRDEKCYLCPYVGYLFAPKFSKINSLEFGVGVRFRFAN
jgi:hypothetical protein